MHGDVVCARVSVVVTSGVLPLAAPLVMARNLVLDMVSVGARPGQLFDTGSVELTGGPAS